MALLIASLRRAAVPMLAALVAALAGPDTVSAATCPGADVVPTAANVAQVRSAFACLLNQQRMSRGLRPLAQNRVLAHAAQGHSDDMVRRSYFSHATLGGPSVIARLLATPYDVPGRRYDFGEALGFNYGEAATPARMLAQLLNSPIHRAYLLAPRFMHVGIGVAPQAPRPFPGYTGATYTIDLGLRG